MNGEQILKERVSRNWEQLETAARLKVSQPYLSLLEAGKRPVTEPVARRAVRLFRLPPTALPIGQETESAKMLSADRLAAHLANLGYDKFSHLKNRSKKINPAVILITALKADDLDARIVEALPWLIYHFPEMNWSRITKEAKLFDAQNRLGFLVSLAEEKAAQNKDEDKQNLFRELLQTLERSKLFREDTFQRNNISAAEKAWLKKNRPENAEYWRVLTNLAIEHLGI